MIVLLRQVVSKLPDVEKVVVIPFVHSQEDIDLSSLGSSALFLEDFLLSGLEEDGTVPPLQYEQVSFHPWNKKTNKFFRKMHCVGRVLSFFSSRRNWDSPNPSPPTASMPFPPGPVWGGWRHTSLAREGV